MSNMENEQNISNDLSIEKIDPAETHDNSESHATKNSKKKKIESSTSCLIKKCSIFDVAQSRTLIESIKGLAELDQSTTDDTNPPIVEEKHTQLIDLESIDKLTVSDNQFCTTCQIKLEDVSDQREHYKCDVHLFNLKQKLKGKPIVSIDEFEALTDISSISGSDSEDEDERNNYSSSSSEDSEAIRTIRSSKKLIKMPKLVFKLTDENVLVMQRCILHGKKELAENNELLAKINAVSSEDYWAIVLVAAGHFAAAIFKGDEVIVHKTFHRYVVRAKRGTVQSQHDKMSHAKSAGANIRRSQEAAFKDDIRILMGCTWKQELEKCKCIFMRVASYNRSVLISSNSKPYTASNACNTATAHAPFSKHDLRVRNIPFMTLRPTFNEVKRVHTILSRLEIYNSTYLTITEKYRKALNIDKPEPEKKTPQKTKTAVTKPKNKHSPKSHRHESDTESDHNSQEESDSEELTIKEPINQVSISNESKEFIQYLLGDELKLFNDIYNACLTNNPTKLNQLLSNQSTTEETSLLPIKENEMLAHRILIEKLLSKRLNPNKGFTLLHLTSELGHAECVWPLLLHGCDPAVSDMTKQHQVAYMLSANKATKDKFRRFMHDFPDRYNYVASKLPGPLSEEQANSKAEKEKEKKKAQKLKKKLQLNESKKSQKNEEIEMADRQIWLSLTDQEKRSLVVDRNFSNVTPIDSPNAYASKLTKEQQERILIAEKRQKFYEAKMNPAGGNEGTVAASVKPNVKGHDLKNLNRCWMCGLDMSTSMPFEYFDYKFCTTKCLKTHRDKNKK